MKKIKALFKSKRLGVAIVLVLVAGLLLLFYFTVFQPFSVRKSLMYLQSDFEISTNSYQNIKQYLSTTGEANPIEYNLLADKLNSLFEAAISNEQYINSAGLNSTSLGQQLQFYYDDVEYATQRLGIKAEFESYADRIENIGSVLMVNVSNTDNYYYMAEAINDSLSNLSILKDEFYYSDILPNDPGLKNVLDQYLTESENYFTAVLPIVQSLPDIIAKNDRDLTRSVLKQIEDTSAQFRGNETNLTQLSDQYFAGQQASVLTTLTRIDSEIVSIKGGFKTL